MLGHNNGSNSQSNLIGAIYARFSSDNQDESSIDQQVNMCRELAAREGVVVPAHLVFADHAISGQDSSRPAFRKMLDAAAQGSFEFLFVDSLSRFSRDCVDSLTALRELTENHAVHVMSRTENIDSRHSEWKINAQINSVLHEAHNRQLSSNVKRGHLYTVENGFSCGHWIYGYHSEPIPGTERGKDGKPRKKIVIHEPEAEWVRRMFQWYVLEERSIAWITRELTRLAPRNNRSRSKSWHAEIVRGLLSNTKYIGNWYWGRKATTRHPKTGKTKFVRRKEGFLRTWQAPELRLVSDEIFQRAQEKLRRNEERRNLQRDRDGRFRGSSRDWSRPRHLLQSLFTCATCGRYLFTCGKGYLRCSGFDRGTCQVSTRLCRKHAEKVLLDFMSQRLLQCDSTIQAVLAATVKACEAIRAGFPSSVDKLKAEMARKEVSIEKLIDLAEKSDDPGIITRLAQRRREHDQLNFQISRQTASESQLPSDPDETWIRTQLTRLREIIKSEDVTEAALLIRALVGPIQLREEGHEFGRGKKLVGRFRWNDSKLVSTMLTRNAESESVSDADSIEQVELDFGRAPTFVQIAEEVSERIKAGETQVSIGKSLGHHPNLIRKAWVYWHQQQGLPAPSCRRVKQRRNGQTLPS